MMLNILKVFMILLIFGQFTTLYSQQKTEANPHPATDVYRDWPVAIQLWTFNHYTFMEALEKTASLGISWVEAYPDQKFSNEFSEVKFHHTMSAKYKKMVKARMKSLGLKLVNYGVVDLPNNEKASRAVFDFAKEMG